MKADKMGIAERLEKLRTGLMVDWGELCARLEIGASMMHYLRHGQRQPSPKLMRRIVALEASLHKSGTSDSLLAARDAPMRDADLTSGPNSNSVDFQLLEDRVERMLVELLEMKKEIRRMKP